MARRDAREAEGVFVIEGRKLLGEAVAAGARVEAVFVAEDAGGAEEVTAAMAAGAALHHLADGVVERVAHARTPQPVLAVVAAPGVALGTLRAASLLVVCAAVADPGNAGTILRSAEAAGADGVVFCDGSVDVFNPKTVRASAGSLFHVPVVVGGDVVTVLEEIGGFGISRLGASADTGDAYDTVDLTGRTALVVGNEAHGLPSVADQHLDRRVRIPMQGRTESLNVGVAAAVLCFEAARQRRAA